MFTLDSNTNITLNHQGTQKQLGTDEEKRAERTSILSKINKDLQDSQVVSENAADGQTQRFGPKYFKKRYTVGVSQKVIGITPI